MLGHYDLKTREDTSKVVYFDVVVRVSVHLEILVDLVLLPVGIST